VSAEAGIRFSLVRHNPGDIATAAGALSQKDKHAGVDFAGDAGDCRHAAATGAPNMVESFTLSLSTQGAPDISGLGRKIILDFKHFSTDAAVPANKAFAVFTMK